MNVTLILPTGAPAEHRGISFAIISQMCYPIIPVFQDFVDQFVPNTIPLFSISVLIRAF